MSVEKIVRRLTQLIGSGTVEQHSLPEKSFDKPGVVIVSKVANT
jgi:hypothetical protein